MKLPEPNDAASLLATAQAIRETWSPNDASAMISDGFVLVGVCPTPEEDEPFRYSLIWPHSLADADYRVRELWHLPAA